MAEVTAGQKEQLVKDLFFATLHFARRSKYMTRDERDLALTIFLYAYQQGWQDRNNKSQPH